jgi:lipopolysaccharide transport system permease protein
MYLNPTTTIIQQVRAVVVHGQMPDFDILGLYATVALVVMAIGYWAFARTRKGFADVL